MARIILEDESDDEKGRLKDEKTLDELGLPRRRLRIWKPIFWRLTGDSLIVLQTRCWPESGAMGAAEGSGGADVEASQ